MPDQEEKVRIVISGEDDDASKTISKVSKALGGLDKPVSGMTSKLNTLGGTLAKLGGIAVGGGIVALGGALAVAAVKGVQFNASMEQTTVAFTTLLKSGDAATKMLEDLQQFAAATPFEFPQLASAAQNLLAMGFAADDLIPIMTDVGNTVSALGGGAPEIDRVVTALGQMSAKGKASAEDLGQLAELGIPIWQQLADKLGVTTAAAQEMVSKGLVPATVAIEAFREGSQAAFGGAMQAQSETFVGLMSTLADNINLALGAFAGPLFKAAKENLGDLGVLVSSPGFQEFAVTMGEKITPAVGLAVDAVKTLVEALSGDWKDQADKIAPIHRVVGEVGRIVRETAGLVVKLWDAIVEGEQPLVGANTSLGDLADVLKRIADLLGKAAGQVDGFNRTLKPLADGLNLAMQTAKDAGAALRGFLLPLGQAEARMVKAMADAVLRLVDAFKQLFALRGRAPVIGGGGGGSGIGGLSATTTTGPLAPVPSPVTAGLTAPRSAFVPAVRTPRTITVNLRAAVVMDGRTVGELVAPVIHQQIDEMTTLAIRVEQTQTPIGIGQSSFRTVS